MRFVLVVVFVSLFFTFLPSPTFASSISSTKYMYDNIGNIQSINNAVDLTKNMTYSYDDLYRLTGATGGYTAGYGYDTDGDILTKTEDQALTLTYTPSDPIASHAPKSVNGRLLKYDGNGNLIEDAFSNLKIMYDYENRPIEIRMLDTNTLLAKYSYDGEGKRVKKEVYDSTIPSSPLKSTTEYVNGYFEKDIPVGKPQVIRKFYVGIAYRENGTLSYSTNDHLSSTILLTTNTGAKQAEYRYYPYGQPILPSGAVAKNGPPNSWIGQKRDDESGLYFLNARYYSPTYGRFVQADVEQDALTRGNKYSYTGENPIGRSDPGGLCSFLQPVSSDSSSDCVSQLVVGTITDTLTRITNAIGAMANDIKDGSADPAMTLAALSDIYILGSTSRTVENWNSTYPIFTDPSRPIEQRFVAAAIGGGSAVMFADIFAGPLSATVRLPDLQTFARRTATNTVKNIVEKNSVLDTNAPAYSLLKTRIEEKENPIEAAAGIAKWSGISSGSGGTVKSMSRIATPHNAFEAVSKNMANCFDCAQVVSHFLGENGISAAPMNYALRWKPHYATYIFDTDQIITYGGHITDPGTLFRLANMLKE